MTGSIKPLEGIRIVSLAVNIPGPVAVARLCGLGATAVKIEPPGGDPLAGASSLWYEELHQGVEVHRLNLKLPDQRLRLDSFLDECDLLVTASRLPALARLQLSWSTLSDRFPTLLQVAIIGHHPPDDHLPGHDLTYQAVLGLIDPPQLPRCLVADLAGAEWSVTAAFSLIMNRERKKFKSDLGGEQEVERSERIAYVSLSEAAAAFAQPHKHGLTAVGGLLGGMLPGYNLYKAKEGWIALAALEPHFLQRLAAELDMDEITVESLANAFKKLTAKEWQRWAAENDLPIREVKESTISGDKPS